MMYMVGAAIAQAIIQEVIQVPSKLSPGPIARHVAMPATRNVMTTEVPAGRAKRGGLVAQRMVDAGVTLFGKTNVPLNLADWQSYNEIYGVTNNPWDLGRTPGGSSGGSGAALAAGLTGIEAGSDVGASIRNPAHYCGVYGHKPTYDVVSYKGHTRGNVSVGDITVVGP